MKDVPIAIGNVRVVPAWLPDGARHYLAHTEAGLPIRELARQSGIHASTVLRQIRRYEARRDDPLIDGALRNISDDLGKQSASHHYTVMQEPPEMAQSAQCEDITSQDITEDSVDFQREALRVLNRLVETGAMLAVASDMEKAIVVRESAQGVTTKTGVVDRCIAEMMALRDWIETAKPGRVSRYRITVKGRMALDRLSAQDDAGTLDKPIEGDLADQHRVWGEKSIHEPGAKTPRRVKYNVAESPLAALARRKDKDGQPFLSEDQVAAGERLREDFELAHMGPRVAQNWERFLTGGARTGITNVSQVGTGPDAARARVTAALDALGPGLADVALRCCCYLEGVAKAETRMGWSARSGKVVLRIALMQLHRHYEDTTGPGGGLIG
ncbi:MAG: helix-turn-helix domain-containing protein [Rhodobacteraceae bacterium]|nr:helix-turn-helix domain-containing protein [Paracoccaceae bacterium]